MTPLEELLQTLAAEDARVVPPPTLRMRVMRAWRGHVVPASPPRRWLLLPATAAVLLAALAWSGYVQQEQREPDRPPESLSVVRVRMPRSALADLGLTLPDPHAAGLVDVDVIVGEDGTPRGINRVALASAPIEE